MTASPLDGRAMNFVRAQFPALESPWAFFDNAGGSLVLERVAERVRDYLLSTSVQLGASYDASVRAAERVTAGTGAAATLLGCRPQEVVLGSSTTQLLRNLSLAMAPGIREGDEVIVTDSDHEANVGAWLNLRERGAVLRFWRLNRDTLRLELDDLRALLGDRTRLVCLTHASNVLGGINPVAEAARLAREAGARTVVDGVAYAPHRAPDVRALGVDYYVCSLYKVYGPHVSVLYGRHEELLGLANLNHYFIPPDAVPYKLQPGNLNFELTYSLGGITDYLEELSRQADGPASGREAVQAAFDLIAAHEEALAERLLAYLRSRDDVTIIGPREAGRELRVPTVSFTVRGRDASEVPPLLDARQVAVRYGDFYARRLVETLGLLERGGVVRASMVHYNTLDEVDRLVAALDDVL